MENLISSKLKQIIYLLIILLSFNIKVNSAEISNDAIVLTIRFQQQITLDSTFAQKVDSGLIAARNAVEAVKDIHVFPDFVPKMLILKTSAPWSNTWKEGNILTGNSYIDSLGMLYKLDSVQFKDSVTGYFLLYFSSPLKISLLSELYEKHIDVNWAEPNFYDGDGDNIEMVQLEDSLLFSFSQGAGDCPAGCIYRYYWYISVYMENGVYKGILQEEKERDFNMPYIYRWNIPERYAITMFSSIDSILVCIRNSDIWWIRKHCIEALWRLYVKDGPWVGEDSGQSRWDSLKAQINARRNAIISTLNDAVNDPVSNVSLSAALALDQINLTFITKDNLLPKSKILVNTWPNPFNPELQIEIAASRPQIVDLHIFNCLGQRVQTLLSKVRISTSYKLSWDATGQASGIYFYKIVAENFTETGKLLLIR